MKRTIQESATAYLQKLMEKRKEALAGLGIHPGEAYASQGDRVRMQPNHPDWAKLQLVDEALSRLRAGSYGSCLVCEKPIPSKRLKALPWVRYCARCQERIHARLDWETNAAPPAA